MYLPACWNPEVPHYESFQTTTVRENVTCPDCLRIIREEPTDV